MLSELLLSMRGIAGVVFMSRWINLSLTIAEDFIQAVAEEGFMHCTFVFDGLR